MTPIAGLSSAAPPASACTQQPQKLDRAAHQFEAMLLQELLKPLTASDDTGGASEDDSLTASSSSGPLESFGTQAVAESLANSGALGFARQIESSIQHRVVAGSQRDTVLKKIS